VTVWKTQFSFITRNNGAMRLIILIENDVLGVLDVVATVFPHQGE